METLFRLFGAAGRALDWFSFFSGRSGASGAPVVLFRVMVAVGEVLKVFFEVLFVHTRGCARDGPNGLDFLLFFAYAEGVAQSCKVTFTDGAGVTHSVTVAASSLYEAAARGIAEFKRSGFAFAAVGSATRLTVSVEAPATSHELPVAKLQNWLDTSGRTPAEQAVKVGLRQMLGLA
jgi:hypothetical protein